MLAGRVGGMCQRHPGFLWAASWGPLLSLSRGQRASPTARLQKSPHHFHAVCPGEGTPCTTGSACLLVWAQLLSSHGSCWWPAITAIIVTVEWANTSQCESKGWRNFSVKGQKVDILDFVGQTVSIATPRLCQQKQPQTKHK